MVKIKICGITNIEDAQAAVELGADALGFVFAKSPRRIDPEAAGRIIGLLPPFVTSVGVFVNEKPQAVEKIIKEAGLGAAQFHGDESPDYCSRFRRLCKVIKAFRIKDARPLAALPDYEVDGYLLDAYERDLAGGTGRIFDWDVVKEAEALAGPIILSGGLNPKNVAEAIKAVKPYAVDVSSGVEKAPGQKDEKLMKEFIEKVRYATR